MCCTSVRSSYCRCYFVGWFWFTVLSEVIRGRYVLPVDKDLLSDAEYIYHAYDVFAGKDNYRVMLTRYIVQVKNPKFRLRSDVYSGTRPHRTKQNKLVFSFRFILRHKYHLNIFGSRNGSHKYSRECSFRRVSNHSHNNKVIADDIITR